MDYGRAKCSSAPTIPPSRPPLAAVAAVRALHEATERALASRDDGPLGDVVEQWYRAAFIEHHGGEDWQRTRQLIEQGRWDELAPSPARNADKVIQELLH